MSREVFQKIFRTNSWGGDESSSGTGSSLAATAHVRTAITDLVQRHCVRSVLDAACGDFNWMSHVELPGVDYHGVDIVPEIIAQNAVRFGSTRRRFDVLDAVRDPLPRVDLIIARDVLVHLPFVDIKAFATNVRRSGATWLLVTTFGRGRENVEIQAGEWRLLNMCGEPLWWTGPIERIVEGYEPPPHDDKALGLWRVEDLP